MSSKQLLISYALRYPAWIILSIILGFSNAIFNGVSTALVVPLVLILLGKGEINLEDNPPIIQKILNLLDGGSGNNTIVLMAVVIVSAITLKNLAIYFSALASGCLARKLVRDLRNEGIRLLLEVDFNYLAKTKIGDLVNQIGEEISRAAISLRLTIHVFTLSLTILTFVAILLSISWQLTLGATILLLMVAIVNQYFIRHARKFGEILSEKSSAYSTALLEILTGMRLIKSVSNEEAEYQRIKKLIDEREQAEDYSQANYDAIGPINEVAGTLAILGIVFLGKTLFDQQLQSFTTVLLMYLFVLFRLMPIVSQLNTHRSNLANVTPSTEIVADFLRRDDKPFMKNGKTIYQKIQEGIRFSDVSFAYPGNENLVLQQVNLWLPKGKTLALVGASGAGKSTMADLLPRFYEPVAGCITIDGKDIREYDIRSLRQAMGIVTQDTFLFNTSVRHNIAYGRENVSLDEIIAAAKRANAYEFIAQLPQGFDTEIGDRGIILSGGQRQRLAIARALLRNPDILILDEATSALDTVSERLVQQAIEELTRDRTTLVIAHRLSTIQKADQIAVLDKGKVVEIGNHEELLKKGGYYTRLYSMQFEKEHVSQYSKVMGNG
jgi:subfamily B ATP-binding cassette protein MsbA